VRCCPNCQSNSLVQTSLFLTRVLLSTYIFICFYLFTGDIMVQSALSVIPLIIRYKNVCYNCNNTFYRFINIKKIKIFGERHAGDELILITLPYFSIIVTLVMLFPNTGLGRILYLPGIFFINTLLISVFIELKHTKKLKGLRYGILTTLITIVLALYFYPQDSGERIWELF